MLVDEEQPRQRRRYDMESMILVEVPSRLFTLNHMRWHTIPATLQRWRSCREYQVSTAALRAQAEALGRRRRQLQRGQAEGMAAVPGQVDAGFPPVGRQLEELNALILGNQQEQRQAMSHWLRNFVGELPRLNTAFKVMRGYLLLYPLRWVRGPLIHAYM